MAVSILRRPIGYISNANNIAAVINQSGGVTGAMNVVKTAHGLSTNNVIYLKSDVKDYNGFVTVEVADANNFRCMMDGEYISYIRDTSVCVYDETGTTNWNCAHLPIVYKLLSTLWPVNSADTVRIISAVDDSNGYCGITASADIKATGSAAALEFVKITGATDDDLNGVWQIITYTSDTSFILNIPYSAANDTALTNASIQYYYNNYVAKVQVWGGLNNGHTYYGQKPYELLATLDLIPDADNVCMFSISEILKKQIEIENNLLLGTLPNNLDAWTGFFIKYGEEFDDSDGTTLIRSTVSYTSDLTSFEGYAVNAMLPFKNVYSGVMSEYAAGDSGKKFLTNWVRPTIFQGKYFDLGLISESILFFTLRQVSGGITTYADISGAGSGVFRAVLDEPNCDNETISVDAGIRSTLTNETFAISMSPWQNYGSASLPGWSFAAPGASVTFSTVDTSRLLGQPFRVVVNQAYQFAYSVTVTGYISGTLEFWIAFTDSSGTVLYQESSPRVNVASNGTHTGNITLTETNAAQAELIALFGLNAFAGATGSTLTANSITHTPVYLVRHETKTIDINCDCIPSKAEEGIYLSWLNNLGGFDYWFFTAYKDHIINITDSGETKVNTFPNWPNSYGEFADTIKKQTYRDSETQILVRSQHLTKDQLTQIQSIKTSPLVQIVNSIYDRRTVSVDTDSFTVYQEEQKLYQIQFTITYTDDVPSQRV